MRELVRSSDVTDRARPAGTRRRALLALTLAAAALATALALPAGAAPRPPRATTTTKAPTTTTTVAPTTTTTVPTQPCGSTILKADGSPWVCTFSDEFTGTTLDGAKWLAQETRTSNFTSGTECFMNSTNNVSVANGTLRLTARKEAAAFTCQRPSGSFSTRYTSGSVSTVYRFSQTYGRFEVRAKLPAAKVKGLQESFWLWPDNSYKYGMWPYSGEIDIAEIYHLYPDRAIPYIHYVPAGYDPNVTNNYCMIDDLSQYHSYVAEWTDDTITILYDGQVCLVDDWAPAAPLVKPQPFDHPFMVALTQALGVGANAFDPAVTPLPATTTVDYVRVWK